MTLNTTRTPLDDIRVRQAIALALDRQALVENVFGTTEQVAAGYMWEGVPYSNVGLKTYPFDKARAAELLDEAGWTLPDDGTVRTKDGRKLEIGLNYESTNVIHRSLAQIVQAQLAESGFKINLTGEETAAFYNRGASGDFDLFFSISWGEPYDPHSSLNGLATTVTYDYHGVAGLPNYATIKDQIIAVIHTTDEAERQRLYAEILTAIHEGFGFIPISYKTNRAAGRNGIENVEFHFSYDMPLGNTTIKR
jgi:nickel transport system substrate-binding protein